MKRFITRIYSLNVFFPYSEKITIVFIESCAAKIVARIVGGTNDVSVILKHRFYSIVSLHNDLDYFNHLDSYAIPKKYDFNSNALVKTDGF